MKPKLIVKEIALLLAVFILLWLIVFKISGAAKLSSPSFEINLHDTYFVMRWTSLVVIPFLIVTTFIYLIREAFFRYRRRLQNLILLLSTFILNLYLLRLSQFAFYIASQSSESSNWTVYPPLSGLPKLHQQPSHFNEILQILTYIPILFIVILVIVAILVGKNWKYNNEKTQL